MTQGQRQQISPSDGSLSGRELQRAASTKLFIRPDSAVPDQDRPVGMHKEGRAAGQADIISPIGIDRRRPSTLGAQPRHDRDGGPHLPCQAGLFVIKRGNLMTTAGF